VDVGLIFVTVAKFQENAQRPSSDAKGFPVAQSFGWLAARGPFLLQSNRVYNDKPIDIVELRETADGSRHGLILGGNTYYG
jgi:hypothetical protein